MSYEPDDSEIEGSRAPLLEHLIELRKRLVISVVALGIGVALCFYFSPVLLDFLLHPFQVASGMMAYQQQHGVSHNAFNPAASPDGPEGDADRHRQHAGDRSA